MGRDFEGQEKGIEIIKGLPEAAKELLSHHLRNPLQGIIGGIACNNLRMIEKEARHIIEDLERFGL